MNLHADFDCKQRIVGYDAQAFLTTNGGTGKGAQLRNLVGPFINQFLGFASKEQNKSDLPLIQEGFRGHTLWEQFSLPRSLKRHKVDIFLAPYNVAPFYLPRRTELILVLHDTIQLQRFAKSDVRGRLMDAYRRFQIPPAVSRARIVLTVSKHSRNEILRIFPQADVRVIPCTVPEAWFDQRPIDERSGYLLMVTSSAPHKNAPGALRAYARYASDAGRSARPLKVVGLFKQAHQYQQELRDSGVGDLVSFLPYLSEKKLIRTYQHATALFFPSFAEGFGIPILEAMATGTPVIAARAASLPEVGGEAACYFQPSDADDMANALRRVLSNKEMRRQMSQRGVERARVYSPAAVREQVIEFWREVSGSTPAIDETEGAA